MQSAIFIHTIQLCISKFPYFQIKNLQQIIALTQMTRKINIKAKSYVAVNFASQPLYTLRCTVFSIHE